jgi:hypothetical protein
VRTSTKDRERFIGLMMHRFADTHYPEPVLDFARTMLRLAATCRRLQEASCNRDYPCDDGNARVVPCPGCENGWHPEALKGKPKRCPDCRTAENIGRRCAAFGVDVGLSGAPRGYTVTLHGNDGWTLPVPTS